MRQPKWDDALIGRLKTLYESTPGPGVYEKIAKTLSEETGNTFTAEAVRGAVRGYLKTPQSTLPPVTGERDCASLLLQILKQGATTTIEAREKLGVKAAELDLAIAQLREEGFLVHVQKPNIELRRAIPVGDKRRFDIKGLYNGAWYRFGFVTDNHLGSRYERLDVLHAAYDHFEADGIKVVYNAGNVIDGYVKRINEYDLHPGLQGYTAQVEYFVKNYPQREGVVTYFITGDDHEGWWIKDSGFNVGEYMEMKAKEAGRHDLKWVGHMEFDFIFEAPKGKTVLRLVHPGGGSSYATSYTMQKLVESYQGGEKPHILLAGHYHKADCNYIRNVWAVQGGCTEDQTPFMRKKKLQAHVGFTVCEFQQAADGSVPRFKWEFFPFFDRGYYETNDAYKMW